MISFDVSWPHLVGVLSGVVMPLVVALVTTRVTDSGTKGLLLTACSWTAGMLAEVGAALESGTEMNIADAALAALVTLVVGQTAYGAVWQPTGVAHRLQELGNEARPSGRHAAE